MPSVSRSQQRYFGAIKGGSIPRPKGMRDKVVDEFAHTSLKGLPQHLADGQAGSDPSDFSGRYNTPIPADRQAAFDSYAEEKKRTTGKDPRGDRYDYDVNADWLAGAKTDERGHGSDQFKKPNHPSFSDQSVYNGVDGNQGGQWMDATTRTLPSGKQLGRGYFQPTETMQKYRSPVELQQYFADPRNGDTNITPLPPLDIHPPQIDMQTIPSSAAYRTRPTQPAPPLKRRPYGQ